MGRLAGRFRLVQPQKIAARRATADARSQAALRQPVGDRAARHRHVRVVVVQQAQRRAAPGAQRLGQPLRQGPGAEHTAVEQQGIGQVRAVLAQESGDVARDGGVARIRQAKGDDATARLHRLRVQPDLRKKTVNDQPLDLFALQHHRAAAAHQPRAAAQQRDRRLFRCVMGQQHFLGSAAAVHQLRQAAGRQRRARRAAHARFHGMRQRQVHVVAPQHQVVAHADARQAGRAAGGIKFHVDQAQVGGAAAHVADQHAARLRQFRVQPVVVAQQPVVERRLGFFQQAQLRQPGLPGCAERQGAGTFVKGRRHGEPELLMLQWTTWKARIPGQAHMVQVAGAGVDRRDFGHLVGRAPGQDGRQPVHRRMRQPALGAGHPPARHLRTEPSRPLADDRRRLTGVAGVARPRQLQRARGHLAFGRVKADRRQQRQGGHFARCDQLVDVEHADAGLPALHRRQGCVSDHSMGSAEVDADDVVGCGLGFFIHRLNNSVGLGWPDSPGRRLIFFGYRPKKISKERRPAVWIPCALLRGNLHCQDAGR